jgi:hypothetical protein
MDKLTFHQQQLLTFLQQYKEEYRQDPGDVDTQIIADRENHHYLLVRVGWKQQRFYHYCLFHFDLKGDKIWIQQNNTETQVGDELMALGVAREDIVLGFKPEAIRVHTGFGVG